MMLKTWLHRFFRNPLALAGGFLVLFLAVVALAAPWIATHPPQKQDVIHRLEPPSRAHWLGTDDLGRDVFSRIVYGARISLAVGVLAVAIAVSIGTVLGLLAGYQGRWMDAVIMRVVDILLCFPTIFLILMVIAFLEPNILNVMAVIGLTSWMGLTRLVRAEALGLRERDFMLAAKGLALPLHRILMVHLLPNVVAPILVTATLGVGGAILIESALSFLGLGVQPPTASWGNMLTAGKDYIHIAWWLSVFPGLAILLTVLSFNVLGEGLRDVLDPRMDA